MKIAITGHRGFLGSKVAYELEYAGHEVVRVDGDVTSTELPIVDGLMHFAAKMGGIGYFNQHQFLPVLENLAMDVRIIDHCQRNKIRLLYPSSACAYPVSLMAQGVKLSEKHLENPSEPDQMYGMEKYFITKLAEYANFDLRVPILHTIYGDNQKFFGEKAKFPPQICYKFTQPGIIEVWGDGSQTRTFLHIDDACKMILEVFFSDQYEGPVNVSHPDEVSVKAVVDILSQYTQRKDIIYVLDKPVGPTRRCVDNTKYNTLYSSRPEIDLEEGFISLYESIKTQIGKI